MATRGLDAIVVGSARHAYYFSAFLPFWQHHAGFVLRSDGRSTLISANVRANAAADDVQVFEATWSGTQRQEQPSLVADRIVDQLAGARRIGVDDSAVTCELLLRLSHDTSVLAESIEPDIWQLRRQKDPDELALMRRAIACTGAMYERARQIIEPGIAETLVFSELHAAAVATAGEELSDLLGNDYACGQSGGAPRGGRLAREGEIYILDLGPAYRGYFSDNCRGIAVDRKPTDVQFQVWAALAGVFPLIHRAARPGVRCNELYEAVDAHLHAALGRSLTHHLGHGVGLQPHEFPHLNPRWNDTLQEGEVFTVEPGIYGPELAGGIRLENQYLVTATGVEDLTPFPLGLAD